jgi:hypothetical protein
MALDLAWCFFAQPPVGARFPGRKRRDTARYFNGDTKAALAAQAVLLRKIAAGRDVQDSAEILVMDQSPSQVPSQG